MSIRNHLKSVIEDEYKAIEKLTEQVNVDYERSVMMLKNCQGKVIVTGVGKSGHVGKKIAASLSSTGTSAFFVHATEGLHGDLGMVQEQDVVLLLSNSGESEEVLQLLPSLKQIGCQKIALTSKRESSLAQVCEAVLVYQYDHEADPLNLAPTISSTIMLVIGDALSIALSIEKKFTKEKFHLYHPGGSLGNYLATQQEKKEQQS
ncbi:arabinose-5-phosphate isomerase [Seinonella peptonophila]|uniref:Arabinose-5-phosphate isomerase n=1 Tax=Seinonella peptonophila TaxID=112248 RepID=A0A1M4T4E2_9BACL|nr:SIS domain-containing protein [Seinonella peptonophila]SHE39197.1 arabinose-5-phosphate isomerase [Seinonella peptonophila]